MKIKIITVVMIAVLLSSCTSSSNKIEFDHVIDNTTSFNALSSVTYATSGLEEEDYKTAKEIGAISNEEIEENYLKQNTEYVSKLIDSILKKNTGELFKFYDQFDHFDSKTKQEFSEKMLAILYDILIESEYEIETVYFNDLEEGNYKIQSPIDSRYYYKYKVYEGEQLTSIIKIKNYSNIEYLVLDLQKSNDLESGIWELKALNLGCYKKNNKTSFEWLDEANRLKDNDQIMQGMIMQQMAYLVLPANSYPIGSHVDDLFETREKLIGKMSDEFKSMPLVLNNIETNPELYTILPDLWHKEGNFGYSIHYATKVAKKNREKLENEVNALHNFVINEMKFDDLGHFTYVAYQKIPETLSTDYLSNDCEIIVIEGK